MWRTNVQILVGSGNFGWERYSCLASNVSISCNYKIGTKCFTKKCYNLSISFSLCLPTFFIKKLHKKKKKLTNNLFKIYKFYLTIFFYNLNDLICMCSEFNVLLDIDSLTFYYINILKTTYQRDIIILLWFDWTHIRISINHNLLFRFFFCREFTF